MRRVRTSKCGQRRRRARSIPHKLSLMLRMPSPHARRRVLEREGTRLKVLEREGLPLKVPCRQTQLLHARAIRDR